MPAIIGVIFLIVFYLFFNTPSQVVNDNLANLIIPQHKIPARNLAIPQPKIEAESAVAFDDVSGYRIFDQNADQLRPIASLTKLMTALVFLDTNPDWQKKIKIIKSDLTSSNKANLFINDEVIIDDLFNMSLIASDNTGIAALVRSTGMSEEEFVSKMNAKAKALNIPNLKFNDPTGLDIKNMGSAVAVAKLVNLALSKNKITEALKQYQYSFSVGSKNTRQVVSTDQLLGETISENIIMIGGKTGHLNEAGYCFAGVFEVNGHKIMTAVLGAPINDNRFSETLKILNWTKRAYLWNNK
jgi:D-alanyl-D-alanine carboxypeptidase